jgi:hypothetical protein
MKPGAVHIRIDELVLHGFDPADRLRIGDAAEEELARLAARHGLPAGASRHTDALDAGAMTLPAGATPRAIGAAIARAVFQEMRR